MFAVPGWAVSASTLVKQEAPVKGSKSRLDGLVTNNKSKKRKRHIDHDGRLDEGDNIGTRDAEQANKDDGVSSRITQKKMKENHTNRRIEAHKPSKKRNESTLTTEEVTISTPGTTTKSSQAAETSSTLMREREKRATKKASGSSTAPAPLSISQHVQQPLPTTALTPLQAKMRNKLTSARFRHLNEKLYTTNSSDAFNLFTTSPELFAEYHAGFAQQVKDSWPQNPVDEYIKAVKTRGTSTEFKSGLLPLPRRKTGSCTIADLGCGDAPLARGCQAVIGALKLKFHNYDLHAPNSLVTKADISNLPLRDGEADVAVFCLSLMGTNWISFVEEAWRILRGDGKGEVWVAEVKSRFGRMTKGRVVENSVGKRRKKSNLKKGDEGDGYDGPEQFVEDNRSAVESEDETDISAFIKVFTRRGFQLREGSVYKRNKMFVSMIFTKTGIPTSGKHKGLKWTGKEYQKQHDGKMKLGSGQKDDEEPSLEEEAKVLKPCVYKTR